MARSKTLFDDRPVEVQELTQIIKIELAKLNEQISNLQTFQKMQKAANYTVGTNKSAEEHSSQVVVSLQSRLAEVSSTFTNVLEMRSQNIKAQRDRREQFSATNIIQGTNDIHFKKLDTNINSSLPSDPAKKCRRISWKRTVS